MRVKAKCSKKLYQSGDFYLFGMRPIPPYSKDLKLNTYGSFTVKGELGFLTEGKDFTIEIEEIETNKYGTTYKVLACDLGEQYDLDNLTPEKSMEIMCEITTPAQAKYCLDAYEDFIKIALTDGVKGFDVKKIYNVGEYRVNAYVRELNTKFKYLDIINKLKEWEFEISEVKTLCDVYNQYGKIVNELKADPYKVLIGTLEFGFEKADKVIMKNRPDLEMSETRCAHLIASVIDKNELSGNTKVNANDLYYYVLNEYPLARKLQDLIVPVIKTNPLFHYDEEEKSVALFSTYNAEYNIAQFFYNKVVNSTKLDIDYTKYTEIKDGTLTDEQQAILKHFCEYNLTIVNAKGGTGKSASSMALIHLLEDNDMTFMTVSPTGKVAKRLRELTGRPACTIHKAVLTHAEDGIWVDCVIVEEGGMIGLDVMSMLVNSLTNPDCRIIINLDLRQIPPISCGCPLRDMIVSDIIDVNKLSHVFRYNKGGLSKMASDSHDQMYYIKDFANKDREVLGDDKDYTYLKYSGDVESTISQILSEYRKYMNPPYNAKPEDICVITPWNVQPLGAINLNNKIQEMVNPKLNKDKIVVRKIRGQEVTFKVGDIVLNTENNYNVMTLDGFNNLKKDSSLTKDDVPMGTCMNGELGKIIDISDDNIIAQFDEDVLVFDKTTQKNLMLGYSLTTYKMQGSEIPYGINLITPQFLKTLNSNIGYTGLSRGRKAMTEIIDPDTLAKIITIDGIMDRDTNMGKIFEELKQGLDN